MEELRPSVFLAPWQSFTAGQTGQLQAVEPKLYFQGGATCTLKILAGDGPGGTLITSQSIAVGGTLEFQRFDLASSVWLTAGQRYTYQIVGPSAFVRPDYSNSDPYAGGSVNSGGGGADRVFRTYMFGNALTVSGPARMSNFRLGDSATAGHVMTADSTGVGTWQAAPAPPTSLPPSGPAGGDLAGTYPNPTIAANAVTGAEIADATVALADLAANSVGSGKIVEGSVAAADLESDAASLAKVSGGAMAAVSSNVGIGVANPAHILEVRGGSGTVDQSQLADTGVGTYPKPRQSFTAGMDGTLIAVEAKVWNPFNACTLEIRDGEGATGTLLTSESITLPSAESGLVRFDLTTPISVTAGHVYTIRFNPPSGNVSVRYTSSNPYAGGMMNGDPSSDMVFRTWLASPALLVDEPTGYVGIGVPAATHRLQLPNTADAGGQGQANAWITYSSRRWKTNIRPIEDALGKVSRLQGVYYDWKPEHGGRHDIGFVAEDVGKVVPELVNWDADGKNASGMDYARVNALLVEAIKEQQRQIDSQQRQIDGLRRLIVDLLKRGSDK